MFSYPYQPASRANHSFVGSKFINDIHNHNQNQNSSSKNHHQHQHSNDYDPASSTSAHLTISITASGSGINSVNDHHQIGRQFVIFYFKIVMLSCFLLDFDL